MNGTETANVVIIGVEFWFCLGAAEMSNTRALQRESFRALQCVVTSTSLNHVNKNFFACQMSMLCYETLFILFYVPVL